MGEIPIPCIDLTQEGLDLEIKDETWKAMSDKVREACETHGYFFVKHNGITKDLTEQLFKVTGFIFDLPKETKNNCGAEYNDRHLITYMGGSSSNPLLEAFALHDVLDHQVTQHFSNLMLAADGNPNFCEEVIPSMSFKMAKLGFLTIRMMLESSNAGKYYGLFEENVSCIFAMLKHKVPKLENESVETIGPHTDRNLLAVLIQNGVQGFQILSKEGDWIQLSYPSNCLLVTVGDFLKVNIVSTIFPHDYRVYGGYIRVSLGRIMLLA